MPLNWQKPDDRILPENPAFEPAGGKKSLCKMKNVRSEWISEYSLLLPLLQYARSECFTSNH
jgi:hypothetical protein